MEKTRIINALRRQWNRMFPNQKAYFAYSLTNYSDKYKGIRREAIIYLKYFPQDIDKAKLKQFCSRFNSKRYLVEFK